MLWNKQRGRQALMQRTNSDQEQERKGIEFVNKSKPNSLCMYTAVKLTLL